MRILNRYISFLLLILTVIVGGISASAQSNSFVSYKVEDGLIMSQIETINQDNNGNLWIGTIGGVSKFNGLTFKNFTQKDGLAEDWVSASHYSIKNNTLWLGHRGGGISILNKNAKTFIDLKLENETEYSYISAITEDKLGNIWIAVANKGVLKYDINTKKVSKIKLGKNIHHISSLFVDKNNALWIGTDNQVIVFDVAKNSIIKSLGNTILADSHIKCIIAASDNEIWIGTEFGGIARLKLPSEISKYKSKLSTVAVLNKENGITSNNIKALLSDHNHNIWIGTKESGVVRYLTTNFKTNDSKFMEGHIDVFSNKFEMKYYNSNTFFQDREYNIWMGTELGLFKHMGELFKIYNKHDDLINNLVWSIHEDSKGNMWFGTSEGISKFSFPFIDGKKQYSNPKVKNFNTKNGLPENIIISIAEDNDGILWCGTESEGVFSMDLKGKVKHIYNKTNGLSNNKVYSICMDADNNIWVGTENGANKIDVNSGEITNYTTEDGLGGNKVYNIYKDSKNRLWMGILGGDLTLYDGSKFSTYGKEQGLTQKFIISATEDENHNLWFAAYGDGIIKYDGIKFTSYGIEDGLYSSSPHFITSDASGTIWVGENAGVEKFNETKKTFSLYGKQQGFVGLETNENAVYKDRIGNIWFGTVRGVVKFDPTKEFSNTKEPLTQIEGLKIFMNDTSLIENATFDYTQNYLTFNTQGICLSNSQEVYYKYQLQGLNDKWSTPTKDNKITYSSLPAGDYTFKVIASNNNGIWNKTPQTYSFTITPPFWKTYWFYGICAILIVSVLIFYIKVREKKLKKRQEELENQVEQRTLELRKEKEIVEKKNNNIRESISYAKRIQVAILPPDKLVKKLIPDSFILYQPKDIVSGDFYWLHQIGNRIFVGAVDCTGHGVPGAFMSLIGYNLLEKIVSDNPNYTPSKVLTALSSEIKTVLRQEEEEASVKDGMDLSICCIDKDKNEIQFSGAYNPIYLARDKNIIEYKANKTPIGKSTMKANAVFTDTTIQLQKDDVIYMFSDGYPDQKGGPKKKKFYYPPFRHLLADIHQLPMEKQKEKLWNTITEWKGDVEQFDDILILGIRI